MELLERAKEMEDSASATAMKTPVVALVSYCSKEAKYIGALLNNALVFADLVVVSMGTRLYSGEGEDVAGQWERVIRPLLSESQASRVLLEVYEVPGSDEAAAARMREVDLHNLARRAGFARARAAMPAQFWTLLLDGDEVPDGNKMREWVDTTPLNPRTVYKLANYWAFLHPRLVATNNEDSVLLAHSSVLTQGALSHPRERDGVYLWHWTAGDGMAVKGLRLVRNVMAQDSSPMFWHFSWVRGDKWPTGGGGELGSAPGTTAYIGWTEWIEQTRRALKAKCEGWGHCGDRDWTAVIDRCMTQIDRERRWPERDFVHGHKLVYLPRLPQPLININMNINM